MRRYMLTFFLAIFIGTASQAQSWRQLPGGGKGKKIFNDRGTLWVIGMNNNIFSFNGSTWNEYPGGGKAIDITVHNGKPYIIGLNNGIWVGTGSGWRPMRGNGLGKAIYSDNGTIWIIGINNNVFRFDGARWNQYSEAYATDIAVYRGTPYVLHQDGTIWKGNGMGWVELPGGGLGKSIACDNQGNIWLIGVNNSVFSYSFNRWRERAGGGKAIDITSHNGMPHIIGLGNNIWKG